MNDRRYIPPIVLQYVVSTAKIDSSELLGNVANRTLSDASSIGIYNLSTADISPFFFTVATGISSAAIHSINSKASTLSGISATISIESTFPQNGTMENSPHELTPTTYKVVGPSPIP